MNLNYPWLFSHIWIDKLAYVEQCQTQFWDWFEKLTATTSPWSLGILLITCQAENSQLHNLSNRYVSLTFMGLCFVIIFYYINPNKIYVTLGTMTPILPTHNIYYKIYMNTDLLLTLFLLKPIHKMSLLIRHEQLLIQTFHHNGNLITEQGTGERNPLFHLAIDTMLTSPTTWKQKHINMPPTTNTNQFQLFHDSSRQQYGMYIIYFSIEHIAFSAEYTLLTTIVILI
jgi:hypothetical protein